MSSDIENDHVPLFGDQGSSSSRISKWLWPFLIGFFAFTTMVMSFATLGVLVEHDKQQVSDNPNNRMANQCPAPALGYRSLFEDHEGSNGAANTDNYSYNDATVGGGNLLLTHAKIWTAAAQGPFERDDTDILVENGVIVQIAPAIVPPADFQGVTVDVGGRYVTPGLVDMHSHFGVYAYPDDSFGFDDGNEATRPTTPYVRARDAVNADDPAIADIRSGGVTYSLILPGSANVMGGQALHVKLRGSSVEEMEIPGSKPAVKMACGENPKRVYGARNILPSTRMGIGFIQRESWLQAAQLVQMQDQWDCLNASGLTNQPRPVDIEFDVLAAILRGQVLLNVHCYMVEDLLMMIRTSKEFNFKIDAFHHAIEAWKVADILAAEDIGVATFPDHWGFKLEAYDSSVKAGNILFDAGVKTSFKSDHPVIFAKYLIFEAARGKHWGLSEEQALATITREPAKLVQLDNIIGSLENGKHGDIVVWDRYPLALGAQPDKVIIEGVIIDDFNRPAVAYTPPTQNIVGTCTSGASASFTVTGATIYLMDASNTIITGGNLHVENGMVQCVGTAEQCPVTGTEIAANNGILVPAFVSALSPIGQQEVAQERNSQDGSASGNDNSMIQSIDGVRLTNYKNRQMEAVMAAGIGAAIVSPQGSSLISGQGSAFYTATGVPVDTVLLSTSNSLHITVGNSAKNGGQTNSVSGQLALLRTLFSNNMNQAPFTRVFAGDIPVVAHVNQMDEISSILRFKRDMNIPKMVLHGAAEAHKIADFIATHGNVSVSISPARPQPAGFETWQANEMAAITLTNAGVRTTLALNELGDTRNLRWEAGYAESHGLTFFDALSTITRNPALDYGIYEQGVGQILAGTRANFGLYSANPIDLDGFIQLFVSGDSVTCQPQQR